MTEVTKVFSFLFVLKIYLFLVYESVFHLHFVCMPVHCMCGVLMVARRGHKVPWNCSHRQLSSWMLGVKLWSFGRAARAFNCGAPAPAFALPTILQTVSGHLAQSESRPQVSSVTLKAIRGKGTEACAG